MLKNVQILIKNVFSKLKLQDEGQLYANCLFLILTIYRNSAKRRVMRMHILILTGVQNGCISH